MLPSDACSFPGCRRTCSRISCGRLARQHVVTLTGQQGIGGAHTDDFLLRTPSRRSLGPGAEIRDPPGRRSRRAAQRRGPSGVASRGGRRAPYLRRAVTSTRMRRIHRRPRGRSVAGAMRGSLINLFCLRSVSAGPEIRPPVRETPLRRTRRLGPPASEKSTGQVVKWSTRLDSCNPCLPIDQSTN